MINITEKPQVMAADLGITILRNAHACRTLEDLQFLLVNDLTLLVPADRTALLVKQGQKVRLAALGGQIRVPEKSGFVRDLQCLARKLGGVEQIVVVGGKDTAVGVPPETATRLQQLLVTERMAALVVVPLVNQGQWQGSVIFFFANAPLPTKESLRPLAMIAPPLAAALAREVMLRVSAPARRAQAELRGEVSPRWFQGRRRLWSILGVVALLLLLPVRFKVGGEARLAPAREHFCYAELTGTVAQVMVAAGQEVKAGELLSRLDDRELAFNIRSLTRQCERFDAEIEILRNVSAGDPEKSAELELVRVQRARVAEELAFHKWSRKKLEIRSPVNGLVVTEKLQRLTGRRFGAGEVFCRIAPTDELDVVVAVAEEDVGYVTAAMPMGVLFAAYPAAPVTFGVAEVAPMAKVSVDAGNVIEVRAPFRGEIPGLRPGMGGVGRITVGWRCLGFVLFRRAWLKVSPLFLYF